MIAEHHLPDDFEFPDDPSHMRKAEVTRFLQFIIQRQKTHPDDVFEFHHWLNDDGELQDPVLIEDEEGYPMDRAARSKGKTKKRSERRPLIGEEEEDPMDIAERSKGKTKERSERRPPTSKGQGGGAHAAGPSKRRSVAAVDKNTTRDPSGGDADNDNTSEGMAGKRRKGGRNAHNDGMEAFTGNEEVEQTNAPPEKGKARRDKGKQRERSHFIADDDTDAAEDAQRSTARIRRSRELSSRGNVNEKNPVEEREVGSVPNKKARVTSDKRSQEDAEYADGKGQGKAVRRKEPASSTSHRLDSEQAPRPVNIDRPRPKPKVKRFMVPVNMGSGDESEGHALGREGNPLPRSAAVELRHPEGEGSTSTGDILCDPMESDENGNGRAGHKTGRKGESEASRHTRKTGQIPDAQVSDNGRLLERVHAYRYPAYYLASDHKGMCGERETKGVGPF